MLQLVGSWQHCSSSDEMAGDRQVAWCSTVLPASRSEKLDRAFERVETVSEYFRFARRCSAASSSDAVCLQRPISSKGRKYGATRLGAGSVKSWSIRAFTRWGLPLVGARSPGFTAGWKDRGIFQRALLQRVGQGCDGWRRGFFACSAHRG